MDIRILCAWCGRYIGTKKCENPCPGKMTNPVTHTICDECFYKAMDDLNSPPTKNDEPNE